jgi:hypothetical protein
MENEVNSFDYITVHIGQSPVQLAKETSCIEKNLDLFKNKKSLKVLYDLNCRVQINKKQKEFVNSSINKLPCIWSDSYDEYPENLLNVIRKSFEEVNNSQKITIIKEVSDMLSPSIYQHLSAEFPHLSVTSISLIPILGITGLDLYNLIMNMATMLPHVEGCVLRGLGDLQYLNMPSNKEKYPTMSMQASYRLLASDICFSVHFNDWLLSHCTHVNNIIDVRTSLWRNVKSLSSRKSNLSDQEFNSLRASTHNLRSIYLKYEPLINFYDLKEVKVSSLFNLNKCNQDYLISPNVYTNKDLAVNLKWASPSICWASINQNNRDELLVTNQKSIQIKDSISAIGFQSPFAIAVIKDSISKAELLINKKAYFHR